MSIDTRYNSRYLGGKPDALIAGSNVELSNNLTLQRRPGVVEYGTPTIPSPDFFFSWQQATLANFVATVDPTFTTYPQANLQLIVDTATDGTKAPGNIYNYSPTHDGVILNKKPLSRQTSFYTVINTMYMGDGVDLYKQVGTNLLTYSNTYTNAAWATANATPVAGATDPTGATNATTVTWGTTGTTAKITQAVTPNYTPVASNTFTFSLWMKQGSGANTVNLRIEDQSANTIVDTSFAVTVNWALYQVTGTALNTATSLTVFIYNPSTTNTVLIYGAQLEVGGPATPTNITLNKPYGVYLWGIQAPSTKPTFTFSSQTGSTGVPWQPATAYSQTTFTLTAVAINSDGTATYTGTITGGGSNAYKGRYFAISGFTHSQNNSNPPGFTCSASTATTITLNNLIAITETHAGTATLLDTIVDSNGNLEVAYTPGTSGNSQPSWNVVEGGATPDGLQNLIAQSASAQITAAAGSVAFPANVTAGNTILVFVFGIGSATSITITDTVSDSFSLAKSRTGSRNICMFLYWASSAIGGATTVNWSGFDKAGWIAIAEVSHQTAVDGTPGSNLVADNLSAFFLTGSTTTTNAPSPDTLFTMAAFGNTTQGFELGNIPVDFQPVASLAQTNLAGNQYWNSAVAFEILTTNESVNPEWTVTNSNSGFNDEIGITVAFKSSVGSLVWYNVGQNSTTGLSPKTGYQYYFSFVNTYTGHRSNVSPLSTSTEPQTGVAITVTGPGMQTVNSGAANQDPQVDAIEVYRNTDGGGVWYQIPPASMQSPSGTITDANGTLYLANPGTSATPGAWSFIDTVQDTDLNTQIYAPIGFLNSPPPAGLTNLEFFDNRLWGSVNNFLYYATGTDDATLLNVLQNGVPPESWEPTNYIPFNSPIVRSIATGVGLVVFTTTDVWVVSGTNLSNYTTTKVLTGIGLGTYNGICIDGSTMMLYTRDRECLMLNVNAGAAEIGFLIGNLIETSINPITCYLARHVKGSRDNAFYFGDGATGWFRLNPNQYGASASGEQTPIWSPFATIASTGGAGAIASIEVQPGIKLLLVGRTGAGLGTILNRDMDTYSDDGVTYSWSATIGSIVLALPGKLAEIESITTEFTKANSTQCGVGVLIDEISGIFESLSYLVDDPPQLATSASVLSKRFYLSVGTVPPVGRHMQIQLTGGNTATKDELLALTVRGALINEQE